DSPGVFRAEGSRRAQAAQGRRLRAHHGQGLRRHPPRGEGDGRQPRPAGEVTVPAPAEDQAAVTLPAEYGFAYGQYARRYRTRAVYGAAVLLVVSAFLWYGDFFNPSRYARGVAHVCRIIFAEGFPPDFTRYREWGKALLDTLAMSVGGTALAVV